MTRGATARLFIAVGLPADVCGELFAWARAALAPAKARTAAVAPRLIDPELMHITLCFLGSRPTADIEPLGDTVSATLGEVGELSLGAPLWLPPRRPRTLTVEVHDERGELRALRDEVVGGIGEIGDPRPGGDGGGGGAEISSHRRFRPHVTVARMREGTAPRDRLLPPTPALSFAPTELVLFRSWLAPEGAHYEALASRPFRSSHE